MFALKFPRLYYVCDKLVIRNLRSRRLDVGPNPGLDNRLKAFQEDGLKIDDNDAEEYIEQSDSSFSHIGQAYGDHVRETLIGKHELRHHIVKEKYFKENMPNLLTWSEKEQIRHLATVNPDEWTPDKIAESFPVTAAVVKKLLKFPWKPASEQRIARHDASAMRNWKELKQGTLDIPENLREHFLKFSDRTIPPLNRNSIKNDLTQEEKLGEFERIVQRCANENEQKLEVNHKSQGTDCDNGNKDVNKTGNTKRVTLDQLTAKIKKQLDRGAEVAVPDMVILDTVSTIPAQQVKIENVNNDIDLRSDKTDNSEQTGVMEYKEGEKKFFSGGYYPQRIRIPKKAYKRGATYKVNDCFYDDDGRFLYRVIGMTDN